MTILTKALLTLAWSFFGPLFFLIPVIIFPQLGFAVFWSLLVVPVIMTILLWFNKPEWLYSKLIRK